ncbi:AI-2E family transporter [Myxococcota bacterium]|nr:AI-2E family transporter [Myxococcota bacterium]
MNPIQKDKKALTLMLAAAAFVIIIAGMKAAQPILVPFLLSVFIAIICGPLLSFFRRKGLPVGLSIVLVVALVMVVGVLLGALIGTSANDFAKALPDYQERLRGKMDAVAALLSSFDIVLSEDFLREQIDPGAAMGLASKMLAGLGNVLSNSFLILITVVFMILEASTFPVKLKSAFAEGGEGGSMEVFEEFLAKVNRYMAIKTWMSLGTGVVIWIWLAILGVDYALLWGVLAFLLNYVPNIGSIIAAVPAVMLAWAQLGSGTALLAALGYLIVNLVVGNVIEPRLLGQGLGLSTLVVFLSLVFWGWVLGPVGMLLSIPLTMTAKIALSTSEETQWLSILLGSDRSAKVAPE